MFITLEGPEGSGKSSQLPLLADFLRHEGYNILTTYEPGGTKISDQVRDILKNMNNKSMHPRTEILLFCSSRAQLVEEVIRPHLAQGNIILSDRYADSTLAYQGYGHQVDRNILHELLNFATGNLWPDLTLLLDIDVEKGLARKRKGGKWDRLDDYAVDFHRKVRQGYLEMASADPQRWRIVDAGQSFENVQTELRKIVLGKIKGL
jgi:dTMP kinase